MAISRDVDKIKSTMKLTFTNYTTAATTATDLGFLDARDAGSIAYVLGKVSGGDALTSAKILANTKSDGSGDEATVKTISLTDRNPDAAGDYIVDEVQASDIMQLSAEDGKDYRYVSYNMAVDEGTGGTFSLTTIFGDNRFSYDGLTSDSIA